MQAARPPRGIGSLARREPLPLSDLDIALVWADPPESAPDPATAIRADAWEVLRELQRCGLTLCANGANAHNPVFSRSRSGWVAAARGWQNDPTQENALLLSAMVADSRPLTDLPLGRALTEQIRSHTRSERANETSGRVAACPVGVCCASVRARIRTEPLSSAQHRTHRREPQPNS